MLVRHFINNKWPIILALFIFLPPVSAQGIDIEGQEKMTDSGITDACHGFVVEMFAEQTGRCAAKQEDNTHSTAEPKKPSKITSSNIELGEKQEKDLDITIECQSEYMCMEQRVRLRNAGTPISQIDYNTVAQHCEKHYACIEYFLRDWPKPLPNVNKQTTGLGLTFDDLSKSNEAKGEQASSLDMFDSSIKQNQITNKQDKEDTGVGFAGLEQHRQQENNNALANKEYKGFKKQTYQKSLTYALKDQCNKVNLNYRTPASPRSIQQDMKSMQRNFEKQTKCYSSVAERWDAQAYADALAVYDQKLSNIQQKYNVDYSKKSKPSSIESQVNAMQKELNENAEKLNAQLKTGPEWIENLYASGTFKRPNSGVNTMAILSQTLTQLNNSLAEQNRQQQKQFNQMMRNINSNKTYKAPQVNITNVIAPKINVPKTSNNLVTPTVSINAISNTQNSQSGNTSFACNAPSMQVCLYYTMPANALKSYRERCASQGNQVLNSCKVGVPNCKMKNFAGSIITYNYDITELEKTKKNCLANGGIFKAR